jgi:hypothetical protein
MRVTHNNSQHSSMKGEGPTAETAAGHDLASGADRDRTGDPLLAKQVLSQLSYRPEVQ